MNVKTSFTENISQQIDLLIASNAMLSKRVERENSLSLSHFTDSIVLRKIVNHMGETVTLNSVRELCCHY